MIYDNLIIGDLHFNENRQKAIQLAQDSIFSVIGKHKFQRIILLGDLTDKFPSMTERLMLVDFFLKLQKVGKELHFIKGTDTHEFSNGIYHVEDYLKLTNFQAHDELKIDNFIFGHYGVQGTKYINGYESRTNINPNPDSVYILGHIHQPGCSFKNVNYVGSVYKIHFDEMADQKRIAIIHKKKLQFIDIESRPMYTLDLIGSNGKIKPKTKSTLPKVKDIDLKIRVETDASTSDKVHQFIQKIKQKYNIEYYRQEISILNQKIDIPKNLNRDRLFEKYCKENKVDYQLALKEF